MSASISLLGAIVKINQAFSLDLIVNPGGVALGLVECLVTARSDGLTFGTPAVGDDQFAVAPSSLVSGNTIKILVSNLSSLTLPTGSTVVTRITGTAGKSKKTIFLALSGVTLLNTATAAIVVGKILNSSLIIKR
jgi:hypothetical protein